MRLFALLAAIFTFSLFATEARAETAIGVVDLQRILSESEAGKSVQTQLKNQREKLNNDITALEKTIIEQEKALAKQSKELPAAEFEVKKKEFEAKFIGAREEAKKKRGAADAAMKGALQSLQLEIDRVVAAISEERKFDLVISRNNVVIVSKQLDITEDVLKRLNDKIKTIAVKE